MITKIRLCFLPVLFFALSLIPLGAFDWGGFISADAGIKGRADADIVKKFTQSDRLTLWMRAPLPNLKDAYFTAEGFYDFKYSHETKKITHLLDIGLFKLSMTAIEPEGKFTFNAGRYGISDLSGFIFAQNADGMELRVTTERVDVKMYGGYTGLLNAHTVPMNLPQFDDENKPYQMAPAAVIGSVLVRLPLLFKQQSLAFEVSGVGGMASPALFTTAALNGPLHTALFYSASSTMTFENGKTVPVLFSNISRFELTSYFPLMSSFVSWNTVFAAGKHEAARIGDFKSFSIISANLDGSVKYAGNIKTGLTGSIKPVSSLLCTANADVFFNVMNKTPVKGLLGVQWQTSARWQVFNDLQLSLSAGQYFALSGKKTNPYTMASIKVLYSF